MTQGRLAVKLDVVLVAQVTLESLSGVPSAGVGPGAVQRVVVHDATCVCHSISPTSKASALRLRFRSIWCTRS